MDAEQRVFSLNSQAAGLYNRGDHRAALSLARQACDSALGSLGENHPLTLSALNNVAACLKATHDYEEAERLYLKSLTIATRLFGESQPESVSILHNLARCYRATGRFREMEETLRRALEIARRYHSEVTAEDVVQCLNTLADAEASLGRYAEAEGHLDEASQLASDALGEGSVAYAQTLQNLSCLLMDLNRDVDAEPLLQKVLAVIGSGPEGEQNIYFARSLHTLALLQHRLGNDADARAMLERALFIKSDLVGEQDPDFAKSLSALADVFAYRGRYAAAEPLYRQAIGILEKTGGSQNPDLPSVLNAYANLLRDIGDWTGAESQLKRAIGIGKSLGQEETLDHAIQLNSLALVYLDQRRLETVETLLVEALRIRRKVLGEASPGFGLGLNNLGGLYREMGDWAQAESQFRQAIRIQRSAPNQPPVELSRSLGNLALILQENASYTEAEALYREALAIRISHLGDFHPSVSETLNNLALLSAATGDAEAALEQKSQVEVINDRLIGEVFSTGSERQRMLYLDAFRGPFFSLLTLVADKFSGSPTAVGTAFDLVQKRKALGAEALGVQRDAVLSGRYPALVGQLHRLNALRNQIANKTLEGPGPEGIEAHRDLVSKWRSQAEDIEKELAQRIPEMNLESRVQKGDRYAIAKALPMGSTLVEFVRIHNFDFQALPAKGQTQWTRARYLAFVVHAGNADDIRLVNVADGDAIDRLIADFRSTLASGDRHIHTARSARHTSRAATALRLALFDPLLPALAGCRHLVIAPDGDLARLPLESLPTSNGHCLLDDYLISYVTVGRDLLRFGTELARQGEKPMVVAFPDYDLAATVTAPGEPRAIERQSRELVRGGARFDPLPGTLEEGQRIAKLLGVKPLIRGEALEGRLKENRSPDLLHIATHGFFLSDQAFGSITPVSPPVVAADSALGRLWSAKENPLLRSGLALAGANTWLRGETLPPEAEDGILTAQDVTGLDLHSTELVVLSACETGLGEICLGEGVFGLRRSFVLAGARTLVMSLWKVPDRETQELMIDFYRRILQGEAVGDALRQAQLAMKARQPDPLYWGAFICQGDAGPLSHHDSCSSEG